MCRVSTCEPGFATQGRRIENLSVGCQRVRLARDVQKSIVDNARAFPYVLAGCIVDALHEEMQSCGASIAQIRWK